MKKAKQPKLHNCPLCDGSGRVSVEDYLLFGGETKCMACGGSGKLAIYQDPDLDNLDEEG